MAGFRRWLQALPAEKLPVELAGVDLTAFDYGDWLRAQGIRAHHPVKTLPLGRLFTQYNLEACWRQFREIAGYIKEYGRLVGREVLVAGNFYNGNPEFDAIVDCVDVMVTEMHSTQYMQPWWFRHVEGTARGRDVLIAENPYGGVVPELVAAVNDGRKFDLLRTSFYEGAASGLSMTFPFGSWMGSVIQESFWAPKKLLDECGTFIESVDSLISHVSRNEVAVLYPVHDAITGDFAGHRWEGAGAEVDFEAVPEDRQIPYWRTIRTLGSNLVGFDSIPLPDESARANDVTAAGSGFAVSSNSVEIFFAPRFGLEARKFSGSKWETASEILDQVSRVMTAK
jgi:hypothetical protein